MSYADFPFRILVPSNFKRSDAYVEQVAWLNENAGKGNWDCKSAQRNGKRKFLFKDENIALMFKVVFGGQASTLTR